MNNNHAAGDGPSITAPAGAGSKLHPPIAADSAGAQLLASGRLSADEIVRVQEHQALAESDFAESAVALGLVSADDLRTLLAREQRGTARTGKNQGLPAELVCVGQPSHPLAIAVYRIRTALFQAHRYKQAPLRIAIVGAERGEGRTFLAANLAVAFAQVGARTLLVDGDLRHGRLHALFNISNDRGMALALQGPSDIDRGIAVLAQDPLAVMPVEAEENLQQSMSPARFKSLVSRLARNQDVLIFDTPAWSESADAQLVAAESDFALVVARMHKGSKTQLQSLNQALARCGTTTMAVPFG